MLQVARLAPALLQSSADLVGAFYRERYDVGGGFVNRAGLPDLYYTVFGLDGLIAGLRVGPVIAIDHASAKVDDYSEDGDAALSLSVSDQELKSTTGQLGLEGRLSLIEGVRSHASITMEREMTGDGRLILFAQNSAPTIVNQWNGLLNLELVVDHWTAAE